jgi:formamidase
MTSPVAGGTKMEARRCALDCHLRACSRRKELTPLLKGGLMSREHLIAIDPSKPLGEEAETGHNRWHESIEPVLEVDPGDTVVYETRDAVDGQLSPSSTSSDVGNVDLNVVHPLTGPVFVRGAQAGDLLEAKIVAIESDPWDQWGYTVEIPGFGFLREEFDEPYIVHWRLHGDEYAESEQIPDVRIRCNPFPGTFGLCSQR